MKVVGLIAFIVVLAIEFVFNNPLDTLNQGILQLQNISLLDQPKMSFFIVDNKLVMCVNNTQNFPITICRLEGKEISLPSPRTIPAHTAENITLQVNNYKEFYNNVKNHNCIVFIKIRFLNVTVCTSERL